MPPFHEHLSNEITMRLRNGEEEAFQIIFENYFRQLSFFAHSFTRDMEAAKDLVQETLYKLWERREKFQSAENIKAFLYISVKNAALNYIKAQQRRESNHEDLLRQADLDDRYSEAMAIKEQLLQKMITEIEMLPEKYREILTLTFVEGMSHREIAAEKQISEATIRKQKERGIGLLKTLILNKKLLSIFASLCAGLHL